MHPTLLEIENELKNADQKLIYQFALSCIEEVANNLEEEAAINAFSRFKEIVMGFDNRPVEELNRLAEDLRGIAQSHQGSKSIDGTRHAAVSATIVNGYTLITADQDLADLVEGRNGKLKRFSA